MGERGGWEHLQPQAQQVPQLQHMHGTFCKYTFVCCQGGKVLLSLGFLLWNTLPAQLPGLLQNANLPFACCCCTRHCQQDCCLSFAKDIAFWQGMPLPPLTRASPAGLLIQPCVSAMI